MTGNGGSFNPLDGNLYEAACDYIREAISYFSSAKAITLTPHEIDCCTEQLADHLDDATLCGVAHEQRDACSLLTDMALIHLKTFYCRKLSGLVGELAQRPFFTELAVRAHLSIAECHPPHIWPSPNERGIADFASREIGPLTWNFSDGVVTTTYHRGVRLHRDEAEGPAFLAVNADGHTIEEGFWRDGRLHRTGGPARIVTDPVTGTTQQTWMLDGRTTRVGAPAYIERAASGRVLTEMWFVDDVFSRTDGPAGIWHAHYDDDQWRMESFSVDGVNVRVFENGVEIPYA